MQAAVNAFQRKLFILLLYVSGLGGFLLDFVMNNRTVFFAFQDALIVTIGILSLGYMRGRIASIILFIIVSFIINLSYADTTVFSSINGFREILFVLCLVIFYAKVFAEGNEEIAEDYINIIKNFGYVYLILQIPVSVYQWSKYGPSDWVGGTLGAFSSGAMTFSIICFVYFLHFFSRNISVNLLLYIALVPLFLNETKISFILIPLMMFFIYVKLQAKNIIIAVGGAIACFFVFNTFYSSSGFVDFDNNAAGIFSADFLNDYLFADAYTYNDVPRFTKLMLAWQLISEQSNTLFFGIEYGMFKGGTSGEFSSFVQTYYWILTGTRPYVFFLLMQGGLTLVFGFLWLYLHINRYFRGTNKFAVFLFAVFFLMFVYNDAFRFQFFGTIFYFFLFYANSPFYEKNLKNDLI